MNNLELNNFFNYMKERHSIWYKKEAIKQPAPWTSDPILQKYNFCNVERELDKGTKHVIDKVLENDDLKPQDKLFNVIFYRYFNTYGFFGNAIKKPLIAYHYNWKETIKELDYAMDKYKLFKIAYMVVAHPAYHYRPRDKHVQIAYKMQDVANNINQLYGNILKAESAEEIHKIIGKIWGTGKFLSYQILLDLWYKNIVVKFPHNSYCYVGSGALPALQLIFPSPKYVKTTPEEWCFYLQKIQYNYWNNNIHVNNIEHNLCEYRKYYNLKHGLKQKKRKYNPIEKGALNGLSSS